VAGDTWKIIRLRWRDHWRLMLGVAVLSTALAMLAWWRGWLDDLERGAYDQALTTFTDGRGKSPTVSVVVIDQSSLDGIRANERYTLNFGSWPYSRNLWARVVEQLQAEGARAVVFDAVMDERSSDESMDLAFAQMLRDTRVPFFLGVSTNANAQPLPRADFDKTPASPLAPLPDPAPPMASPVASTGESLPQEALPAGGETFPKEGGEETFPEAAGGEFADTPDNGAVASVTPEEMAHALAWPVRTGALLLPRLEGREFAGETAEHPAHTLRHPVPPIPVLVGAVDGFGLVDTETDPDGFMRRTRFAYTDGVNTYPTLPVRVAAGLLGASEVRLSDGTLSVGGRTYAVDPDGGAAIDYGGGELHERFRTVPLLDVLDGWVRRDKGQPSGLPSEAFRGKVVVIGGTALGLSDIKATSFQAEVPGVMKQAAVLETLLGNGRFITRAPLAVDLALTLLVALASVVLLMTTRWTPLEIAWPVALLLGMYLVTGRFLSSGTHVLTALPSMAGLLASVTAVAFNHLVANRETEFVRAAFSRFMEPKLVEQMISERKLPRLDGENVEISAFFSDIRGFSTFSERFKEDPRSLVRILNTYLTRVSGVLLKEGGCLDKYIGDAVVCLFGAPMRQDDHAVRACRGALAAKAEVDRMRAEFSAKGLPDVYTRIGVNSAVNFVGNFGSEQLFSYTAIGDGMNLAARLEGANKAYGSVIMIGPRTYELAREHIEVRELDRVRVAGKTEAVTVYELLSLKGGLDARKRATVERYHAALALYREARFDEAASMLETLGAEDPDDGPTKALLERCHKYAKAPPPDFDGVASLDK